MADDGDGALTLELQAFKVAQNATMYKGSSTCPSCGIVMNPTEYMYSRLGVCTPCAEVKRANRIKRKMA
jgi:hypothetical protein